MRKECQLTEEEDQNRTDVLRNTPIKRKRGRVLAPLVSLHTPILHPLVSHPFSAKMMMYFWVSTEALQGLLNTTDGPGIQGILQSHIDIMLSSVSLYSNLSSPFPVDQKDVFLLILLSSVLSSCARRGLQRIYLNYCLCERG